MDYKSKYLKYKTKYINLKNDIQVGGGVLPKPTKEDIRIKEIEKRFLALKNDLYYKFTNTFN